jgi:predicted DNA-binding transcriptional regulator AlpA
LGTHEAILRLAAKEAKEKMSLPYPPPYQDLATLSQHICAAESTIENWVRIGIFPQPRKVGGKRLWQWKEVERHLAKMNDTADSLPDEEAQRIREATRAAASRSY